MSRDKREPSREELIRKIAGEIDLHYPLVMVASGAILDIAGKAFAEVARHACLVPPDGGSPTKEESEMCERVASAILALTSEGKSHE